eukprot:CAMPEP_0114560230 /NCGR_PEP_ID=MMETSP0114-20121206/11350_1 /TAXON_ID=31324 /ORGANISM="Goniomonas sp, Strain m" /LENGTH=314 /DNA_ID=CAMNT_0001745765 /DNA_START=52 /DNA_END=996 /DNA_ORIENTATION=+
MSLLSKERMAELERELDLELELEEQALMSGVKKSRPPEPIVQQPARSPPVQSTQTKKGRSHRQKVAEQATSSIADRPASRDQPSMSGPKRSTSGSAVATIGRVQEMTAVSRQTGSVANDIRSPSKSSKHPDVRHSRLEKGVPELELISNARALAQQARCGSPADTVAAGVMLELELLDKDLMQMEVAISSYFTGERPPSERRKTPRIETGHIERELAKSQIGIADYLKALESDSWAEELEADSRAFERKREHRKQEFLLHLQDLEQEKQQLDTAVRDILRKAATSTPRPQATPRDRPSASSTFVTADSVLQRSG